jgi:ribonuclease E
VDVGTFLLNEKRPEIHAVEMRHRVNIVIIPNVHMETPVYEILRLRHDQLNQEDIPQPSYRLAETPQTEGYKPATSSAEPRAARPEAAVKGITPTQPAPSVAPVVSGQREMVEYRLLGGSQRIIDKIFSWFRGNRRPEAATGESRPTAPSKMLRDNARRGGRGRRDGQPRADRAERPETRQASPRPEAEGARDSRRPRPERGERRERPDTRASEPREAREQRPPRGPRPPAAPPVAQSDNVTEIVASADTVSQQDKGSPVVGPASGAPSAPETSQRSRRNRRGGRRDRAERKPGEVSSENIIPLQLVVENPDGGAEESDRDAALSAPHPADTSVSLPASAAPLQEADGPAGQTAETAGEQSGPTSAKTMAEMPSVVPGSSPREVTITAPEHGLDHDEPPAPVLIATAAAQEPASPSPVEEAIVAPSTANHSASLEEAAAATPADKVQELSQALESSGLVLVETDPNQVAPGPVESIQTDMPAPRRRRPAPPAPPSDEPLVQVETGK